MQKLLLVTLISLISICANAQQSKIDSLSREIKILKLQTKVDSLSKASNTNSTSVASESELIKLKADILNMQTELTNTQTNLFKFQQQFRTGTIVTYVSLAVIIIAAILPRQTTRTGFYTSVDPNPLATPMAIVGALGICAGGITHLDAHKYIGWAGKKPGLK
jgi:hypothetical protein